MKNIKLMVFALTMMFFLGMGSVNAQEISTVIIKGRVSMDYTIEIIKPDYEVEQKVYKYRDPGFKELNFYGLIKKEMDYWLNQGYELKEVINGSTDWGENALLILIKEE